MIRRSDVYRLKSGAIVTVIDQPKSNEAGVNCMVIGGDSTTYPPGSWDIYVFFRDLTDRVEVK